MWCTLSNAKDVRCTVLVAKSAASSSITLNGSFQSHQFSRKSWSDYSLSNLWSQTWNGTIFRSEPRNIYNFIRRSHTLPPTNVIIVCRIILLLNTCSQLLSLNKLVIPRPSELDSNTKTNTRLVDQVTQITVQVMQNYMATCLSNHALYCVEKFFKNFRPAWKDYSWFKPTPSLSKS